MTVIRANDKVHYRSLGDETLWHEAVVVTTYPGDDTGLALIRHETAPKYTVIRCQRLVIRPS